MSRRAALAGGLLLILVLPGGPLAATGGPDAFGYTWADDADGCPPMAPPYAGGQVELSGVAAALGPVDLGFRAPFFGAPVTQAWIHPNGFLSFSAQPEDPNPVEIVPGGAGPNHFIAALWAAGVGSADITYEALPESFHVTWELSETGLFAVVDLVFRPNGEWQVQYLTNWDHYAVGYRDASGAWAHTLHADGPFGPVADGPFPRPWNNSACVDEPILLGCDGAQAAACGDRLSSSLPGPDPAPASGYICTLEALAATERVFAWAVPALQPATVTIDDPSLDLLLVDGLECNESACLARAEPGTGRLDLAGVPPGPHYLVVDAPAAGTAAPFELAVDCGAPLARLDCGTPVAGDTSVFDNARSAYPGHEQSYDGPEAVHALTVTEAGPLTALLSGAPAGLRVLVFTADLSVLLAEGAPAASVPNVMPGEYVVVVDGLDGAEGPYTLEVSCGARLDCAAASPASCSRTVSGDTSLGTDDVLVHACSPELLDGRESVHRLFNPQRQRITVRFLSSQPGQRVSLLASCNEGDCRLSDELQVSCPLLPVGEYFLVVDGPAGSEGPYELEVSCSESRPGLDLTVTAIDAGELTGDCRSFDVAGRALVVVSNIGDAPAPAPFEVLLFEDDPAAANGAYDPGSDNLLGSATVSDDLPGGETIFVEIDAAGTLQFRDNTIFAVVDPERAVAGDTNRANDLFDTGRGCEFVPPVGVFDPVVEWHWQSSPVLPDYLEVDTIPLVGDVNADGWPDVVVVTAPEQFRDGIVRVLDGRDGREIWSAADAGSRVYGSSNLALGELDGDPGLEIVGHAWPETDRLVALDDDGSFLWLSAPMIDHPPTGGGGWAPSLADLDCNGVPEVVVGANVFDATTGNHFWTPAPGGTRGINGDTDGALSVVLDVNGDGRLEVVAGPTCYEHDPATGRGEILWRNAEQADGTPAVGNFDDDDAPEIVVTSNGSVYLLEGDTGELIWRRRIPTGRGGCAPPSAIAGGPPTVADFDGDCEPEIGVAGADWYVVWETDGSLKWQAPIFDCSSHRTASTVFDFDGDGAAEVAFMDEQALHVFRGRDGAEIARMPAGSHTWIEMISVADVDGDNDAEIIMPLNPCFAGGDCALTGVQVIGDRAGNWVNTRRIWNQHAYHVDNVRDDGTIPPGDELPPVGSCERESWLRHDTYRDQIVENAVYQAPDLTLSILDTELTLTEDCFREVLVTARVGNGGAVGSGGAIRASFYDVRPGGEELLVNELLPPLDPGEFGDFEIRVPAPRFGELTIRAVADDDGSGTGTGSINECREDNNDCTVVVQNDEDAEIGEPPAGVGWTLRAFDHGPPRAPAITAEFEWRGDEGLPRPAGDHYHVHRSTDPRSLAPVSPDPWADVTWSDSTPRAAALPQVHFYRIFAADGCERTSEE